MRETSINKNAIAECISCGNELYDGDSVYLTCLGYFCPECIKESLTVCRKERVFPQIIYREERNFFGMKADLIRIAQTPSKG